MRKLVRPKSYVVKVACNPTSRYSDLYGPFDDANKADAWARENAFYVPWSIVPLKTIPVEVDDGT